MTNLLKLSIANQFIALAACLSTSKKSKNHKTMTPAVLIKLLACYMHKSKRSACRVDHTLRCTAVNSFSRGGELHF